MKNIVEKILQFEKIAIKNFDKIKFIERKSFKDFDNVDFPIFWIIGLRWAWKSTYLLSRRKNKKNAIYISCDWSFLSWVDFLDLILYISKNLDINTFYLDEIQFLENWEGILKNIYDLWGIKIIFSWSSKLNILSKSYDLSRRVIIKQLNIFSFSEYIKIKYNEEISFSFEQIITNHTKIAYEIIDFIEKEKDKEEYLKYWEFGYFYQWIKKDFYYLLENSLKKSIYEDIPQITSIDSKNLSKIEKLLFFITNMWPSEISINNLSKKVNLDSKTTKYYIEILERLGWIYLVEKYWNLTDTVRKDKKIYLSSNNLAYLLVEKENDKFLWKVRETFFLQNILRILGFKDWIKYKKRTDFVVYYKWKEYEFEIWWKSKKRNDKVFVVKDDILIWQWNEIPLWLFGFIEK